MRRLAAPALVLVGAALLGGVAPATASTGASIDVGSIDISEELLPGGEYKLPTFGVRNPGTDPTNYQLVVAYMDGQELRQPPADWFHFSPSTLTLAPGESRPVTTTLTVPPGAEPGEYLGLIGPRIMSDGEGAQVGAGAAARVTFTIVPSSWLEGSLRWLWGFLMANPWIAVLGLLLIVLLLAWLFRRRFRISVARRA